MHKKKVQNSLLLNYKLIKNQSYISKSESPFPVVGRGFCDALLILTPFLDNFVGFLRIGLFGGDCFFCGAAVPFFGMTVVK